MACPSVTEKIRVLDLNESNQSPAEGLSAQILQDLEKECPAQLALLDNLVTEIPDGTQNESRDEFVLERLQGKAAKIYSDPLRIYSPFPGADKHHFYIDPTLKIRPEGQTKERKLTEIIDDKQLTIIAFGATWCGPCMEETDELKKIIETKKDEVQLIYVSADQVEPDFVRKALPRLAEIPTQLPNNLMYVFDHQHDLYSSLAPGKSFSYPLTLFIDQSGVPIHALRGYMKDGVETVVDRFFGRPQNTNDK